MKPVRRHANEGRSMAITHDYVDYLDEQIDIAPAGSQEELQAAQTIAEEMKIHGLEATIEEFDAKSIKSLGYSVYLIFLFIGIIFAGTSNVALIVFGVLLVVHSLVLSILAMTFSVHLDLPLEARMLSLSMRLLVSLLQKVIVQS